DLQHGNILLVPGAGANSLALKLIDYDGMWTPALAKVKSGEVGHANYQHPQRVREGTYSAEVDRFPLLLIATALRALTVKGRRFGTSTTTVTICSSENRTYAIPINRNCFGSWRTWTVYVSASKTVNLRSTKLA